MNESQKQLCLYSMKSSFSYDDFTPPFVNLEASGR